MIKIVQQIFSKNGLLVAAALICLYLVCQVINSRTEYRSLQATCSLQKEALRHPAVTVKPKTVIRYITRTVEVKPDKTSTTTEVTKEYSQDEGSVSGPVIPQVPAPEQAKVKPWAAGPCLIADRDSKQLGVSVERDILKYFRVNATLSQGYGSLGLLYRF